jgi:hypothetical protein
MHVTGIEHPPQRAQLVPIWSDDNERCGYCCCYNAGRFLSVRCSRVVLLLLHV